MIAALVRERLVALGVTGAAVASGSNWVCVVGGLTDRVNAPQVAVSDAPGLFPLTSHDSRSPLRPGFQVLVRGEPSSYAATSLKVQEVWAALHRRPFGDVIAVEAVNNPLWLGYSQDDGRPMWSLNFVAYYTKE